MRYSMRQWGIRQLVMFIALFPAATVALFLSVYSLVSQLQDIEKSITERGFSMVRQLAPAAEYGVFTANSKLLQPLLKSVANEPDINSVLILDQSGKLLTSSGTIPELKELAGKNQTEVVYIEDKKHKSSIFIAPILKTNLIIDEYLENELGILDNTADIITDGSTIGWLAIEFDTTGTEQRRNELLLHNLSLALLILIFVYFLATRLIRDVTTPILNLTDAVKNVEEGKFDISIPGNNRNELGRLAQGFNTMAASIKDSKETLEQRVIEATDRYRYTMLQLERRNAELDSARTEAIAANKSKSEFLANMSHEIRTPINGLLGFLNLLQKTQLNSQQNNYVGTIDTSAKSILAIISDILDLSRIEAGKLSLNPHIFELRQIIENTITLLSPKASEKGIEIYLVMDSNIPSKLIGDDIRLTQIITNLLSNAIKFVDKGEIRIECQLESINGSNVRLSFRVSDTGIGIAPEDQVHIFDSFSQVESGIQRSHGGTGLGLAITKKLVEMMQGKIGVDSKPGEGSTFIFDVLLNTTGLKAKTIIHSPGFTHARTLILTNNNDLGETLTAIFKEWNINTEHQKITTNNSLTQLNIEHAANDFDVILIDSDLNGHKNIIYNHQDKPILILLEDINQQLSPTELQKAGYATSISKPISSSILFDTLSSFFEHRVATEVSKNSDLSDDKIISLKQPIKVLLVDDNEINRSFVVILLQMHNITVDEACDGQDALDKYNEADYDCILMDIHMPGMDGLMASKLIKRIETNQNKHTPIIALTADVLGNFQDRNANSDIDDFLAKPVNELELFKKMEKWCKDKIKLKEPQTNIIEPSTQKDNSSKINADIIDEEQGLHYSAGQRQTWYKSLKLLSDKLERKRHILSMAIDNQQWDAVYSLAHELKGSALYTGALRLSAVCEKIETLSHTKDITELKKQFTLLESHSSDFQTEIDKILIDNLES